MVIKMLSIRLELFVDEKDLEEKEALVKAIARSILNDKAIITKSSIFKVSDEEMRRLFTSYLSDKNEV